LASFSANFQPSAPDDEELCEPSLADIDRLLAKHQLTVGDGPLRLGKRGKKALKGLPARRELEKLARVYIRVSRQHYPQLAKTGILPPDTDEAAAGLAEEFEGRFLSGDVPVVAAASAPQLRVAAAYCRYSDDNSSARSLDDQLEGMIVRAAREGRFIPWGYVFADASISARTSLRRGYRLCKEVLRGRGEHRHQVDTLYIDDFSRASRSAIESFRLYKLIEREGRRLAGVRDGFDSDNKQAAAMAVMVAGMCNEWFVSQLRAKVLRGMKGAAGRDSSTGKPRFGYQLVPMLDAAGNPILHTAKSKAGRPVKTWAIDPDAMPWVEKAARMFAHEHVSYKGVARHFNDCRVDGRTSWTGSTIRQILACPAFIGVLVYNRQRLVLNEEAADEDGNDLPLVEYRPNPRSEWVIRRRPELRAWTDQLWKEVRRRAYKVRRDAPGTGKKYKKRQGEPTAGAGALTRYDVSQHYPRALLKNILVCGSCGAAINVVRAVGKYRQYGCTNGCTGVNGCKLRSSKSCATVDGAVLRHLAGTVLNESTLAELVSRANAFLAEESRRPKVPTADLEKQIRGAKAEADKYETLAVRFQSTHDVTTYMNRAEQFRAKVREWEAELAKVRSANAAPPPPLAEAEVLSYLGDLRGLLEQSVAASNDVLKPLLGTITVTDEKVPGKSRAEWRGEIKGDLIKFVAAAARKSGYPWRATAEYLNSRGQTMPVTGAVTLAEPPKYEVLASDPRFQELLAAGQSTNMIHFKLGVSYQLASDAVGFAKTGDRPAPARPPSKPQAPRGRPGPNYRRPRVPEIADEVARLREQKLSFATIAKQLGVSESTAMNAFHHAERQKRAG
jgi:DNA invertase Pin-like site-specific DNA recombinase